MELTTEDKERIEREAKRIWKDFDNQNRIIPDLIVDMGIYATIFEREQFEQERKDAYDAGLMCQRILDKDQIEKLETERTELRNKVIDEAIAIFDRGSWSATQIVNRLNSLKK